MQKPRLFGTDGVRGKANETLTTELAMRLGTAVGRWILGSVPSSEASAARHDKRPFVVIGRDTRISCDMLESALSAGITSTGVDVISIGVAPTPAVSYSVLSTGAQAGIVISASHNPFPDNGIKLFGADGRKLPDAIEDDIQSIMDSSDHPANPTGGAIGVITRSDAPIDRYISHVVYTMSTQPDNGVGPLQGMPLVLDCANGAASQIAPRIFDILGADVVLLHATPNGVNINVDCGSTRPKSMADVVRATGAAAGLAFDGDADRVMMADENGDIVDGDRMMAIIGGHLHRTGSMNGDVVVATIMSNVGLEKALAEVGVRLYRTDVGDRYVAEAMDQLGASIGGEQSGHILLPFLSRTGDGIITGLQVLRVMRETGKSLSELASVVENCPQKLVSIRVADKKSWEKDPEIQAAISSGIGRLGSSEWLSVRPSGTEPLIRVMAQGTDADEVNSIVKEICSLVEEKYGLPAV